MTRGLAAFAFLLVVLSSAQAQQAWRVVGEQGEIRYSDRPRPGAEKVQLAGPGRWSSGAASDRLARQPSGARPEQAPAPAAGPVLTIMRPSPHQTVRDEGGALEVALDIRGSEKGDARLVLELDGAEVAWEGELPLVRLKQVWRGEHRLRARLVAPDGKTLSSSEEVRFYKRQPSAIKAAASS